jgi:hypothetical protein
MNSLFKEEWKNAMREELKSLLNNHTWKSIQQLPAYDSHAIGSKWIFKTKLKYQIQSAPCNKRL